MDGFPLESVEVLGEGRSLSVLVSERAPSVTSAVAGETRQQVRLLAPSGESLAPPVRLLVRGYVARVIGSQAPPIPGEPSLITCQRVHSDLPDSVVIFRRMSVFDRDENRDVVTETGLWSGEAHVVSGDPRLADVAGEQAPINVATITLPEDAVELDLSDAWLRVVTSIGGLTAGAVFRLAGDVLDSTSPLRRVIGHRKGVL